MVDGFDWNAAGATLYEISKAQIARFIGRADRDDLYGFGFFCDRIEGVVPIANTRRYHDASYREYVERGGTSDEDTFKWDIGNWENPAGLTSSTEEQMEFDSAWEPFREPLSRMGDDYLQGTLEALCGRVLRLLREEGAFSEAPSIEGFIVLGPDDRDGDVLAKRVDLP